MANESEKALSYQKLVLEYEELGTQIQALLRQYDGYTEKMPDAVLLSYRQLAQGRNDLYNQIKQIEATWLEE